MSSNFVQLILGPNPGDFEERPITFVPLGMQKEKEEQAGKSFSDDLIGELRKVWAYGEKIKRIAGNALADPEGLKDALDPLATTAMDVLSVANLFASRLGKDVYTVKGTISWKPDVDLVKLTNQPKEVGKPEYEDTFSALTDPDKGVRLPFVLPKQFRFKGTSRGAKYLNGSREKVALLHHTFVNMLTEPYEACQVDDEYGLPRGTTDSARVAMMNQLNIRYPMNEEEHYIARSSLNEETFLVPLTKTRWITS